MAVEYTDKVISFQDLTYTVSPKGQKPLTILDGLSGTFKAGEMTALMGPSGSGKSTLLDILCERKNQGSMTGALKLAGRKRTGYVEQFDTLVGELTVGEMLMYTAELLLPAEMPLANRKHRVEQVIEQLKLDDCRDTVIGGVLKRGISGGQAKRVNIGLALIPSPPVLFLDEPTTGLDSHLANEVMLIVRQLATPESGRIVVATMHTPTALAFSLFDHLMLLRAGETIYDGPRADCKGYMEDRLGFGFPTDGRYSVVEWLVEITSDDGGSSALRTARAAQDTDLGASAAAKKKGEGTKDDNDDEEAGGGRDKGFRFAAAWAEYCAERGVALTGQASSALGDGGEKGGGGGEKDGTLKFAQPLPSSGFFRSIGILWRYRSRKNYQSAEFVAPRLGDKVMFALLILTLYWDIGKSTDAQGMQSTASLLYFIMALCGYGAAAVVPSLTLERPLFIRETSDGCYSPQAYWVYKLGEEAAITLLTSMLFAVVVFWSCALKGSFLLFVFTYCKMPAPPTFLILHFRVVHAD